MCILHILNSFIHLHSLVSSCYSYISVMQYRQSKLTVGIFFAMQYLVINTTVKGYIKNGLGNSVYTFGVNNTPNLCVLVLFLSLRNFIISICYCCIFKLGTVFFNSNFNFVTILFLWMLMYSRCHQLWCWDIQFSWKIWKKEKYFFICCHILMKRKFDMVDHDRMWAYFVLTRILNIRLLIVHFGHNIFWQWNNDFLSNEEKKFLAKYFLLPPGHDFPAV